MIGYGDITGHANSEYVLACTVEFLGICLFGYIAGNVSEFLKSADNSSTSLIALQQEMEEEVGVWLLSMQRSQKKRSMHHEYFIHTLKFYNNLWDKDYFSITESEFFKQLKPSIQNELLDHLFEGIYKEFNESFFCDLEISFKREIVKRMRLQHFENFPLYHEKYEKDRHSIPCLQPRLILKRACRPIAVFFIVKGEVYASNSTGKYCYFKFKEKSLFGETHLVTNSAYGYNIFYEENKSFSALVVPANEFIEVCQNYPNSFKVLKERAVKKRKLMKQMKINALNQLILYSISKKDRLHPLRLRAKIDLYLQINPTIIVNSLFRKMDPRFLFRKSRTFSKAIPLNNKNTDESSKSNKKSNKFMNIKADSFIYEEEKVPIDSNHHRML